MVYAVTLTNKAVPRWNRESAGEVGQVGEMRSDCKASLDIVDLTENGGCKEASLLGTGMKEVHDGMEVACRLCLADSGL